MGGKGSGGSGGRKPLPDNEKKKRVTIFFSPWFIKILKNCGIGQRKFIEGLYLENNKKGE